MKKQGTLTNTSPSGAAKNEETKPTKSNTNKPRQK